MIYGDVLTFDVSNFYEGGYFVNRR